MKTLHALEDDRPTEEAPEEASRSSANSLSTYYHQIRGRGFLSREEEHELALHYAATGDSATAERLVGSQLRLVVKIAWEYARRDRRALADLVQEGNLGLLASLGKYDPNRGIRLSTYAAWWIRAYMRKYLLDHARLVRLGTTEAQRKLFFGLRKEKERLEAQGIDVSSSVLAASMQVPENDVIDMESRLGHADLSLDAPFGDDDQRSALDRLTSPEEERPDISAETRELRTRYHERLERFRAGLTGRDLDIFRRRLLADTPETLKQVGERHGISRERTRQLEMRLMKQLKQFLEAGDIEPTLTALAA